MRFIGAITVVLFSSPDRRCLPQFWRGSFDTCLLFRYQNPGVLYFHIRGQRLLDLTVQVVSLFRRSLLGYYPEANDVHLRRTDQL